MTEKEWVRLVGKDGVYLVEGEDYTVDREKGILKHRVRYRRRAGGKMTEKEAWSKIRVINYLLQNIDDAMGERDVKASVKSCLMEIQEEGFISSFELIEKGDLLRIDIPGMFFLEFDSNRKAATIQNVGHVESVEVQHAYHK